MGLMPHVDANVDVTGPRLDPAIRHFSSLCLYLASAIYHDWVVQRVAGIMEAIVLAYAREVGESLSGVLLE